MHRFGDRISTASAGVANYLWYFIHQDRSDSRRKRQQGRASVKLAIEDMLDKLPEVFTKELYEQKCNQVWQHVYDVYGAVEAQN